MKNKYITIMRENFDDNISYVKDPVFGTLRYRKTYVESTVSLENKVCTMPFQSVEINDLGEVNVCCGDWNPAIIGNVLEQDLKTVWHSFKANTLRKSILDGTYRYCNSGTCETIKNDNLLVVDNFYNEYAKNYMTTFPTDIKLSIDQSCNLECPSCRIKKINHIDHETKTKIATIARNVFSAVFAEPHDQRICLSMDGSGEIFGSEVYRELFQSEKVFNETYNWPNLIFEITTNGVLMTEKIQKKYSNFFSQVTRVFISIDAGNKESYYIVRKGGNWDLLWENIDYFYNTIKHNSNKRWVWTLIIQKDNLESIPEFIEKANSFQDNLPILNMTHLLNWGTFSEKQYLDKAVHLPSNPLYEKYIEIINSPLVANYKRKLYAK